VRSSFGTTLTEDYVTNGLDMRIYLAWL